jgi:acyl-CoA synthetase (AMP-forming)/AMP-acid ligase II
MNEQTITICATPMVHAFGCTNLFGSIESGGCLNILDRFDADLVLNEIEQGRGNRMVGLPFMFALMLERQLLRRGDVSALKVCLSSGDVLPVDVQRRFTEAFGVELRSVLGMTEAPSSFIAGLSTFRLRPGVEARLLGADGQTVTEGQPGELLLRGPNVSIGYWEGPGIMTEIGPDGWYRTGDILEEIETQTYRYVSRRKDLIVRGGSNISPVEVEQALLRNSAVRDAAVIGVPDSLLGERVAAFVELMDAGESIDPNQLLASLREQIADYKIPEMAKILPAIPRTHLGKVDRKALRELVFQSWDVDNRIPR